MKLQLSLDRLFRAIDSQKLSILEKEYYKTGISEIKSLQPIP